MGALFYGEVDSNLRVVGSTINGRRAEKRRSPSSDECRCGADDPVVPIDEKILMFNLQLKPEVFFFAILEQTSFVSK